MEDTASRHLPAGGQGAYWLPVMAWSAESSDEELMLGYRDGDAGAFDVLYARHKGGLYRYLHRQCRDAAAAEELFQDVWMNLIRARTGYTVQAKFTTYLYRLAHNRLIDHYRKNSQAAISSMRVCLSGMRRSRHWEARTPSSDSARLSQEPCFGV